MLAALGVAYRGRATRRTLLVGAAGFSILLFAVALSHWWLLNIPLLVALGLCSITFTATANTRLQLVAPPHMRGRVMSIYQLLFAGTTPFGSLVIGCAGRALAASSVPSPLSRIVCGLGVIAGLLYLRTPRRPTPPRNPTRDRRHHCRTSHRPGAHPAGIASTAPADK